jgi:hypothetical protein
MEAKVALWREVLAGTRYTQTTAMARYPQLTKRSVESLPSEIARKPKSGNQGARDVVTYLASDVDALVARRTAPEPVDPWWREVEAGTRYTLKSAMEQYPQFHVGSFKDLPFEIARQPKSGPGTYARDVKTYLVADVDALVARIAAPEEVDQRWLEVESGARYDARTAMKRYPQLYPRHLAKLPFEIARRPKIGKAKYACDVFTYPPVRRRRHREARRGASQEARARPGARAAPGARARAGGGARGVPRLLLPDDGRHRGARLRPPLLQGLHHGLGAQPDDVPDVPRDAPGRLNTMLVQNHSGLQNHPENNKPQPHRIFAFCAEPVAW